VTIGEAKRLNDEERFRESAVMAERLVEQNPRDSQALYELARARWGLGDFAGCADVAKRIPIWSGRRSAAALLAGLAMRKLHEGRRAEAEFLEAIARDPEGIAAMQARMELVALYAMEERRGPFEQMVWQIYDRLDESRKLVAISMHLRLQFEQVLPETNAEALRRIVERDPSDANAIAGLASALANGNDLETARTTFERAVALAPDDAELRERYGELLNQVGDIEALSALLASVSPETINRAATWRLVGVVAQTKRDLQGASDAFERAIERDPLDIESRHRLSQVLYQLGRRDDAARQAETRDRLRAGRDAMRSAWDTFASAFEKDPEAVTSEQLLMLARGCAASGLESDALAIFREVARRDPANVEAREWLKRAGEQPIDRGAHGRIVGPRKFGTELFAMGSRPVHRLGDR
jgi:Tfp pilus assembly protein PilF